MRGILVVMALGLCPALATAQTALAWKFKAGDVVRYERIAKDKQATDIKGQILKQDVQSTWVYRFETLQAKDDMATLQVTIEQVSVQHAIAPAKLENKFLEKLKGAVFTVNVTSTGEITSLSGYDKALAQMADKRDDLAKALKQQIPEAALRYEIQQTLAMLPKQSVTVGARWQFEGLALPTPPLGRFLVTLNAVHASTDRAGHQHLDGILTGKFERPDPPAEFFRVVGGNLSLERGNWSCIFDNDRGLALSQTLTLEMKGELTVEIVGTTAPVGIVLRRDVTTRLLPRGKE